MNAGGGSAIDLDWRGERLSLRAEGAILWRRQGKAATLLLADPHFGKTAALRSQSVAIPGGLTSDDLARLDRALAATAASRLVVLGDFLHAREGRAARMLSALAAWRARHPALEVVLVRGNHDRRAGDPPPGLDIRCVDGPFLEGPFAFRHEPAETAGRYTFAGHLHPAVRLQGAGQLVERVRCFHFGEQIAVLPAFGGFTGSVRVRPKTGDRVFLLADDCVLEAQPARERQIHAVLRPVPGPSRR